ncbi:hypothetical protein V6N13_092068 [Hibiscus sabdariffa]
MREGNNVTDVLLKTAIRNDFDIHYLDMPTDTLMHLVLADLAEMSKHDGSEADLLPSLLLTVVYRGDGTEKGVPSVDTIGLNPIRTLCTMMQGVAIP